MASTVFSKSSFDSPRDQSPFSLPWKSSDLVLLVEERKLHVHRSLLRVASPVFETMFSSNFKEKSALEIPLPGKKKIEIEQLLNWMYPDKDLSITKRNCFSLLRLATEYQIDRLKKQCEEFVSEWCEKGMTAEQAIWVVVFGQKYPLEDRTVRNCVRIFASQEDKMWSEMKQHMLFSALDAKNVQLINEARIFHLEDRLQLLLGADSTSEKIVRSRKRKRVYEL